MKAHGYALLQMVTLLSELMELMTAEHERNVMGAATQERHLLVAHEESHPFSARLAAGQPGSNAVVSPDDQR